MRKIILQVAVSLDGFIEGPRGEYDWCFTDQDYGMKAFLQGVDTIFMGRKTFELAGDTGFGKKQYYVFSNSLTKTSGETRLVSGDWEKEVRRIKTMTGKDIWLFGGAALTASLMNVGLVDEIQLAVHPVILGKGRGLFQDVDHRVKTALLGTKTYDSGLVMLVYKVVNIKYEHL